MKLEEVINKYCNKNINAREELENNFREEKPNMEKISPEMKKQIRDTIDELNKAIELSKKQLSLINHIEKKIKFAKNISDEKITEINDKLKEYENELKDFDYIKYFIERILIIESMAYKEVKSKYYISKVKGLKEKMKYYRSYRVNYLKELEKCRNIFLKSYTKKEKQVQSNKVKEREGLA
jgi:uncharacterized protein CbrC (UPF0167 family)